MATKNSVRGFVSYPCPFYTPKNKIATIGRALKEHPEYEFAWERKMGVWWYTSTVMASPTVARKRKNLNWAKAHEVGINSEGVIVEGVEWRPCIVANKFGLHDVVDYADNYLINKDGVIAVRGEGNGCTICKPYRHNGEYYCIDFNNKGEHVNQKIVGLLARSWGDEVAKEFEFLESTGDDLFVA